MSTWSCVRLHLRLGQAEISFSFHCGPNRTQVLLYLEFRGYLFSVFCSKSYFNSRSAYTISQSYVLKAQLLTVVSMALSSSKTVLFPSCQNPSIALMLDSPAPSEVWGGPVNILTFRFVRRLRRPKEGSSYLPDQTFPQPDFLIFWLLDHRSLLEAGVLMTEIWTHSPIHR